MMDHLFSVTRTIITSLDPLLIRLRNERTTLDDRCRRKVWIVSVEPPGTTGLLATPPETIGD